VNQFTPRFNLVYLYFLIYPSILFLFKQVAQALAKMQFSQFQGIEVADAHNQNTFFLFPKLDRMFNLVKADYKANMADMTDDLLKIIPTKEEIKIELDFLRGYLTDYATRRKSLKVFSHNDLLLANIIHNLEDDSIKFIDYEYGEMNYQAYDVANHFNEYAGVDSPDYSLFPNREFQLKWLSVYLNEFYKLVNEFYAKQERFEEQIIVDDLLIEQFYEEVNKFTSSSHLLWGIWSLIQAQNSSIDFNFVNYAKLRFTEYFKHKKQLVKLN